MLSMTFTTLLALAASASAAFSSNGLSILAPGGDNLWWVANSDNNVAWTCSTSKIQTFTFWINNTALLTAITPLGNVQNNFDCVKLIPANIITFPIGTGYTVFLSDITNVSNVYAISDPFEIKAQSAGYPLTSSTPTDPGAHPSNTASGASGATNAPAPSGNSNGTSSGNKPSSGVSVQAGAVLGAGIAALVGVIGGVVAVM